MKKHSVNIITMGCSKNLVDSEVLMKQLELNNVKVEHEGEGKRYDTVIINTCGFIHDAKEESIEKILEYVEAKESGLIDNLYVTGCLSERYKDDLQKEISEVDQFFGVKDMNYLLNALKLKYNPDYLTQRVISTLPHYSYLKIAEGCNRTCSFCAIPLIRGNYISRTIESLVDETKYLSGKGVKELLLISQDISFYGYDNYKKYKLPELVSKLSDVEGINWMKLHYTYPTNFPLDILDVINEKENVCKYLDIPFQHISDNMLTKMRRNISKKQTLELIDTIRKKVPGIHIRTTMLTGHPGETEKDFKELVEFVETQKFERLGVFTYSHEEDTYSYKNFKDSISEKVKTERSEYIMSIQQDISLKHNENKIGKEIKVIIDRQEGTKFIGRTEFDSPDVDGEVIIDTERKLQIGDFYSVTVTSADEYDLYGKL